MLARVLLVAAILAGLYFLVRYLRSSAVVPGILRAVVVAVTAGFLLLLTVRGGGEIAVPLLAILVPFLLHGFNSRPPSYPTVAGSGKSGRSIVTTRFFEVTLDHVTGAMSGMVREGRFAGCFLQHLTLEELLGLWRECRTDLRSVAILEAYLDRHGDPKWRDRCDSSAATDRFGDMNRDEAYRILGLQPGASREEIQTAYRRLIQRLHPDHGGSVELAARLNQARDVLMGTKY